MQGKVIGLIGTGVFIHLSLTSFLYSLSELFEDFLFHVLKLEPITVEVTSEIVATVTYLLIFMLAIQKLTSVINDSRLTVKQLFLISFFTFVTVNIFEFILPFLTHLYRGSEYYIELGKFNQTIENNFQLKTLWGSSLWYARYVILAFFIYLKLSPPNKKKNHVDTITEGKI